jgi:predicted NAD/FAD-binding protein
LRVAVIGGGVAGLTVAWLARGAADVVVYDRAPHLGGHVRSIPVEADGETVHAEAGFRYLFDATHPTVLALLRALEVPLRRVAMSTSVRAGDRPCVLLPPRSPRQVARLLADRLALRGAGALLRIGVEAGRVARVADWSDDLSAWLGRRFAPDLCRQFLVPFFAASWGMPPEVMARFAAYDVVKVVGRGWGGFLEVAGGASRYVAELAAGCGGAELRCGVAACAIRRDGRALLVEADDARRFDQVVLATPAPAAAALAAGLDGAEPLRDACARFRYLDTEIAIHRDVSLMPARRDDWAIVNYTLDERGPFVTEWCGQRERRDVFRTWLAAGRPPPRAICHRERFQHLVVTPTSLAAQRALEQHQGAGGLWAAGMYVTDVDVQESAIASAVAVARRLFPDSENLRRLERAGG